MKRTLFLCLILTGLCVLLQAADVNGQWQAQIPGRDGAMLDTTLKFKVAGDKLTGSTENQYGEREITNGKVSGDDISFQVNLDLNGDLIVFTYTGKISGNEIKFKRERKGGDIGPPSVEFVAKRK